MSNRKVYLAKNILASGPDVEYVKSNLARIQGIDIVESGMGIKPSECSCFIIIPNEDADPSSAGDITLSKNVAKELKQFTKEDDDDYSLVYIYSGKSSFYSSDVEEDSPVFVRVEEEEIIQDEGSDDYNYYSTLNLETDESFLLEEVSLDIGGPHDAWVNIPRFYHPSPEYAMPAVPSVEERKLKKSTAHSFSDEAGKFEIKGSTPIGEKRLLLLRRK